MTDTELHAATETARTHAKNLRADIQNASTRTEHMRLSTLTIEAEHIVSILETLALHPDVDRSAPSM